VGGGRAGSCWTQESTGKQLATPLASIGDSKVDTRIVLGHV